MGNGEVAERESKGKDRDSGAVSGTTASTKTKVQVKTEPSDTKKVEQIIISVQARKETIERQIGQLKSMADSKPQLLNEAVIELRVMNGILEKFKI